METIRIPNSATYSPVSLTDLMFVAPLATRVLIGATLPGRLVQAAAAGAYAGCVLSDWASRRGVRKIDFLGTYGSDVKHMDEMPVARREEDVQRYSEELMRIHEPIVRSRDVLAADINERLTTYIAGITGQRVETSSSVREMTLARLIMPFASGSCDVLSGDIAVFRSTGIFEPHILAHEFCHRKGYLKELEAQALAYLALSRSRDPQLRQSALAERVYRNLRVLDGDDPVLYNELLEGTPLDGPVLEDFRRLRPPDQRTGTFANTMRELYDSRMKLTGQNGLSDYDRGFTNFLYTYEKEVKAGRAA
ncbi:MAG: DUF3810 domain-containing protein [Gemmatimonadetes bacterium]|nr:DUF3810 domain-containing protein [Gemmatimonadota bacterium]MYA64259.1 DUF3810 domain-containing protein [Gemmatimonadota bacterium]MYB98322.1 DUF3810 domain-containing protein [Gemmatimonadota bacterium]MYH53465.1 DUF3810 domain-containing protein [Gemmatimonadota bacterium]MYI45741.1 DUF3810 domain-containing protein [Gemmatimonadota bacterium]